MILRPSGSSTNGGEADVSRRESDRTPVPPCIPGSAIPGGQSSALPDISGTSGSTRTDVRKSMELPAEHAGSRSAGRADRRRSRRARESIAAAIRSVDPEQPIYDARTLDDVVDRSLAQRWLQTALLATFASIALLLASIGVYGVIAYAVGQRQREFGIRLALGAHRSEIVGLVMRRGALLFAVGAAIGIAAAAARAFSVVCSTTSAASIRSALASRPEFCWPSE